MALKQKIKAADFAALPALLKEHYASTADADGNHVLDLEGGDDVSVLKRTIEYVKNEKAQLKAKLDAETTKRLEIESALESEKADKSKGDERIAKIENGWKEKMTNREKELIAQRESVEKALQTQMVESVVSGLAGELALGNPANAKILSQLLSRNFKAEIVDGKARTVVLDDDGQPTVLNVQEFKKKVVDSGEFKSLITANNSSGGGAAGAVKGGGATGGEKKIADMNATEQAQFANKNPEKYREYLNQKQI
jgi:hypothetical protein